MVNLPPLPFEGPTDAHPFCRIVEDHLAGLGIGLEDARRVYGDLVQFHFYIPGPISINFCLDRDEGSKATLCQIYSVIGMVSEEYSDRIAYAAATRHYFFQHPIRYAIDPQGLLVLQFHCSCEEITQEVFALRVSSIIPISIKAQKEFVESHGLEPLPMSWASVVRPR